MAKKKGLKYLGGGSFFGIPARDMFPDEVNDRDLDRDFLVKSGHYAEADPADLRDPYPDKAIEEEVEEVEAGADGDPEGEVG